MKKRRLYLLLLLLVFVSITNAQLPFTAGNIVVCRIGSGGPTAMTSGNTYPVFLDEYTPDGLSKVQTIALPTVKNGSNHSMVLTPGGGLYPGMLTLSQNKQYLALTGYDTVALVTVTSTPPPASITPRTVALVKFDGSVNTTTALNDFCSTANTGSAAYPTTAITSNGTDIWVASPGSTTVDPNNNQNTSGVRYCSVGSTSSVQVSSTLTNGLCGLQIADGQLYASSTATLTSPRLGYVGSGLPMITGQGMSAVPGVSTSGTFTQFIFLDENPAITGVDVLYIVNPNSSISKYSFNGTTWISNGSFGGLRNVGITGTLSGNIVTLYVTAIGSNSTSVYGGQIVKYTDATGYNGSVTTTPPTSSTIVDLTANDPTNWVANSYSFRGIALVPQAGSLPVSLTDITATKQVNDIILNWQTATEINSKSFEIERSTNTINFTTAGSTNAKGSNSHYNFIDVGVITKVPTNSTVYYRLKMIDNDGKATYSKIVAVKLNDNNVELVSAYPNPFDDAVTIKVNVATVSNVNFSITDIAGKIIRTLQLNLPAGNNTVSIPNLQGLDKGTYMLKASVNGTVSTIKLVK